MRLKIVLSFCVLLSVFGITLLISDGSADKPQKEDPTPVQLGVMTERQKRHSRLYEKYRSDEKITDLLRLKSKEVEIRRLAPLPFNSIRTVPPSASDIVRRIACDADLILIGEVKDKVSQVTESQDFVFTDYTFSVQRVLKNTVPSSAQQSGEVNVTRPGGAVLISGKTITAIDETFQLLGRGKQYLLFLRYLPDMDSFMSIETGESYELEANDIKPLNSRGKDSIAHTHNSISLITEIEAVVANLCKKK
jgi:hypothetical protein